MKQDSIWAFAAGILLTFAGMLIVAEFLFPNEVGVYMVPTGAVIVFLWLNGYRTARKRRFG